MALGQLEPWRYLGDTEEEALTYLRAVPGDPFPEATYADEVILEALASAVAEVETATGRWFVAREGTLTVHGQGGRTLWLPCPIIEVTAVTIEDEEIELDQLDIHAGVGPSTQGDPRQNPFIAWKRGSVTATSWGPGQWPREERGAIIEVEGSFGYVEASGATPSLIRILVLQLLYRSTVPINDDLNRAAFLRGAVIQELTINRSFMLGQGMLSSGSYREVEIDRTIRRYRRPADVVIARNEQRPRRLMYGR